VRKRNASTVSSNACFASIIAQCPQLGNTCSSALGMVRIGISAMSSRADPIVAAPGEKRRRRHLVHCRPLHRGIRCPRRGHHLVERRLAVHAPGALQRGRVGRQCPTLFDQLIGDQRPVVHHRVQPVDQPLASRVLGELLQKPDAFARARRENVRANSADGDQATNLGRLSDRIVDADTATHRIADDVNGIEAQRVDKCAYGTECGHHRVTAEVVADAETGEFQNQATEMLGERAENAAEIAPPGNTGTGAVQE
jgi:hypothetical protein